MAFRCCAVLLTSTRGQHDTEGRYKREFNLKNRMISSGPRCMPRGCASLHTKHLFSVEANVTSGGGLPMGPPLVPGDPLGLALARSDLWVSTGAAGCVTSRPPAPLVSPGGLGCGLRRPGSTPSSFPRRPCPTTTRFRPSDDDEAGADGGSVGTQARIRWIVMRPVGGGFQSAMLT